MKRKRSICGACGRLVALRTNLGIGSGKHRAPHKCPHGRPWNPGGTAHYRGCPECAERILEKEGAL